MGTFEGWVLGYLVNSVWQVPVLFAAGWLMARASRSSGPVVEHRIWVVALVMESLVPGVPVGVWDWVRAVGRHRELAGHGRVSVVIGPGVGVSVLRLPTAAVMGLFVLYGAVVAYFVARLVWGLWRVAGMRRASVPVVLVGEAALCWERCLERLGWIVWGWGV